MKNLFKILLSVALLASVSTAATAAQKTKKEVVKCTYSATIDCESCKNKVMKTLPYQKGVKSVKVDLPTKKITVEYDASKSSNEAIIANLSKIDIRASVDNAKAPAQTCSDSCCSTTKESTKKESTKKSSTKR